MQLSGKQSLRSKAEAFHELILRTENQALILNWQGLLQSAFAATRDPFEATSSQRSSHHRMLQAGHSFMEVLKGYSKGADEAFRAAHRKTVPGDCLGLISSFRSVGLAQWTAAKDLVEALGYEPKPVEKPSAAPVSGVQTVPGASAPKSSRRFASVG